MGLQKEIWLNSLVENLFADNTFAKRSVDLSGFVEGKTVHVPNAGVVPEVVKNRKQLPAQITQREDKDLDFNIHEYTTDPIVLVDAEKVELSYSKRESIIANSRMSLQESVHADLIYDWVPSSPFAVKSSGSAVKAHIHGATGNRKAFTKDDVFAVKDVFDVQDIPQLGRCMLLDAIMYNQLLKTFSDSEAAAFRGLADLKRGIIGNYLGFDFYMRSKVAKASAAGNMKAWTSEAAADSAAGIAWQEGCVSRAIGQTKLFDNDNQAAYYGDVISALVRAGGQYMRNDKKGVCLIYQETA